MNTTAWSRWFFVALLLGGVLPGCRQTVEPAPQPPRVTVAHPEIREIVDEDDYNGVLQASKTENVQSRVRGHIQKIHFKDGDLVKRGDLLIELDPEPFKAAVEESAAQVDALRAQEQAAEKNLARATDLLKSNAISRQEQEKIEADARSFAAQRKAKEQEKEKNELDLKYSRIRANTSGRISRAMLTEGNLVGAGGNDPVLATIVAADRIHVYFNVDERALQRYQMMSTPHSQNDKQPLPIRAYKIPFRFGLESEDGFPHEATIDYIGNKVDPTTGTMEVRGVADNQDLRWDPGSRVRVRIPVSKRYKALLVPDSCVLTDQDKRYLLVLGQDNVVLRRDVVLGRLLDDGMRVVLGSAEGASPITAKDWVITLGLQRARVDYPVLPVDADAKLVP